MSNPTTNTEMSNPTTNTENPPSRASIVQTIKTPLGFFALVVLTVEVIFGVVAAMSAGLDRTYLSSRHVIDNTATDYYCCFFSCMET
jgi:quinol-cytochrome oxidoreductase complex cytochrome b subunit